jgi:hypothetical protein
MLTRKLTLPLLMRIFVALSALLLLPLSANVHTHDNHQSTHETLQLDHGKKWSIDASLHTGMTRIKTSIEKNIKEIHHNKFNKKQYAALANEITTHLSYLFEHCKLPQNADVQLHTLLASIMQGSDQMRSQNNQRQGAIKIVKALQNYPVYFNDENWTALSHK